MRGVEKFTAAERGDQERRRHDAGGPGREIRAARIQVERHPTKRLNAAKRFADTRQSKESRFRRNAG